MGVISDWYNGQTILVTGGTGFMGKVLLEKLLRACPGIRCIYVLARSKRGSAPAARIEEMAKLPLFEKLIKSNTGAMKKLVAIESDITKPDLALSKQHKQKIISEVTIVFNMAASLRLEAEMKPSILNNTTGTKHVLDLCLEMKQLKAFIHLSTAFSHGEVAKLEERIYPPPHDPHDIMHAMEWLDEKSIQILTTRLLGTQPNCYTYSKRLAEYLVYEYRDKFPVCIARPSIVLPTILEPIPGWVDSKNGPIGLLIGGGKGVIRSMMCSPDNIAEVIPVDVAINGLIVLPWKMSTEKSKEVPVYNMTAGNVAKYTYKRLLDEGKETVYKYPFENTVWYPDGDMTTNRLVHYLSVIFFHYLPAYLIDFLLLLARQKRFMVQLQNRIYVGLEVLQYFTMNDWYFHNEKFKELTNVLSGDDGNVFYLNNLKYDYEKYMVDSILGARVYTMKEPLSSLPRARKQLFIMYCLHWIVRIAFFGFLVWLLLQSMDTTKTMLNSSVIMLHKIPVIGNLMQHSSDSQ